MEPAWYSIAVFALTNRDKSPVSALFGEVGFLHDFLLRAKFGEFW